MLLVYKGDKQNMRLLLEYTRLSFFVWRRCYKYVRKDRQNVLTLCNLGSMPYADSVYPDQHLDSLI